MTALTSVVGFLSPAIASAAMTIKLSLPFWLGTVFLLLAFPTVLLLPVEGDVPDDTSEARRPLISSPTLKAQASRTSLVTSVVDRAHALVSAVGNFQLALLLLSMFLTSLASADTKLLAQYISKRYHWTFASACYFLSSIAVSNFFLLTGLVPPLLTSHGNCGSLSLSDSANIRYARFCLVSSVFGALAIGLSSAIWVLVPSLVIYALGVPLSIFTLSLANSPNMWARAASSEAETSDPQSHVFSIIMMVKTLGSLIGAPLMAALWYHGIQASLYGTPYLVSSLTYLAAWCVFWNIGA